MSPERRRALEKCFRDIERAASIHATNAELAAATKVKKMITEVVEELASLGELRALKHRVMEAAQEKVYARQA